MKPLQIRVVLFVLFLCLGLNGCSGSGSSGDSYTPPPSNTPDPTPAGITISGNASAPGGSVARLENNRSVLQLAVDYVIRPGYAAIIGLQPVAGATVQLIRIDDNGNQVGDVLASTVTSLTGDYSLQLPSGVPLAANLVVRITGNNVSMGALVVDQTVNINPISEFVRQKFVDAENLVLANLPFGEVIALQGRAAEFDLVADADLTALLERLEADLGDLMETEIAVIGSVPDTGNAAAAAAGVWSAVDIQLGFDDNEAETYGTFNMGLFNSRITIAAGASAGEIEISENEIILDAWSNLNISESSNSMPFIHHQFDVGSEGDGEHFSATIDAAGNILLEEPFEEDLQTVDIGNNFSDPEGDGPDFGWRSPARKTLVDDLGNHNALVAVDRRAQVRYETMVTNNPPIKDAVNPEAKDGDEVDISLMLVLKQGDHPAADTAANLAGAYGVVSFHTAISTSPSTSVHGMVIKASIDADSIDILANDLDEVGFTRTQPNPGGALLSAEPGEPGQDVSIPYTVDPANGMITVDGETPLEGWTNADGSLFSLLSVGSMSTGSPGSETVSHVEQEMLIGVKLPDGLLTLEGNVFRLYALAYGAGTDGSTELFSLGRASTLTVGSTTATVDARVRSYERSSDTGAIMTLAEQATLGFTFSLTNDGAVSMATTETGSDSQLKGFVSADGKVMLLRLHEVGTDERLLGVIVAVRQ